jgi:mRNA interferase RelE/StbE
MPENPSYAPLPSYAVEIEPDAWKKIMALPETAQRQIFTAIEALEAEPRPGNAKPLKREWRGYWRVRSGNYRVIYTIEENRLVVVVVKIGDRRDIYE